jgi:hypothetical protein
VEVAVVADAVDEYEVGSVAGVVEPAVRPEHRLVRDDTGKALEDVVVEHQAFRWRPAIDGHALLDDLLDHEDVARVDVLDIRQELDVGGVLLVGREQLSHRRDGQRRSLQDVLAVYGPVVAVPGNAALVAGVELSVREEEVDRPVRQAMRARKALVVILALGAQKVVAHALDGVEVEACACADVRRQRRQLVSDRPRGRVRLRVPAIF